ncbi:MAG: purine-binding chemotaxis protein CheW [Ruminococcus sp.]|nr:purine-binding chemotaxis protein CheW [Ruminococcus sp.]
MSESDSKYLIFSVSGREYAMCFSDIRMILPAQRPRRIPDFPDYVLGDIVNDGQNVTIIDLRRRFGFETKEFSERDCMIVCDSLKSIGVMVDSISGFKDLLPEEISPPPDVNEQVNARFISGSFLSGDKPCYILKPELIIRRDDEELFEDRDLLDQ